MHSDELDDLFRRHLGDHQTPPGDALWQRLQAGPTGPATPAPPTAEPLDQLFRQRLAQHATPPPRALWERLEDEHLRPRPRRAAWAPLALAATLALFLLAGGAGLWRHLTGPARPATASTAGQPAPAARPAASGTLAGTAAAQPSGAGSGVARKPAAAGEAARFTGARAVASASRPARQTFAANRATPAEASASSASTAGTLAQARPRRQPARSPQSVAAPASPAHSLAQPAPLPQPADEPVVAVTPPAPQPAPAAPGVAPASLPAQPATLAATVVEVDVRRGGPATASAVAAAPARRGLGGRLLQQAAHLARGERLSLAELTGLPQNLSVEANVAGRHLSTTIQL